MDIEHISVSRHSTWELCKVQYKYKYHLKVPSPEETPFYFTYGKIVHKIAEEFVKNKGERILKEITEDVINGKISLEKNAEGVETFAPPIPFTYKMRMPDHLSSIQTLTGKIGYDGLLEYKFRYDLDPPNNKFVTGFIDRLIQKGDNWYIFDYKTTKKGMWRKNEDSIIHDLQLRCYARVVQREFNVPADKIHAALYYLEGGNLIGAKFSEQSLLKAEAELLDAYNQIKASNPDQVWGNVGEHCRRCDYRSICPFYKGK